MHHESSPEQQAQPPQPKKSGINPIAKKILGIVLFFLGLVAILGGYVASHVFQNGVIIALGVAAGFILIISGAELSGVE